MRNYDIGYCYLCQTYSTYYIRLDYGYCNFHVNDYVSVLLKYPTFLCICNLCEGDGIYDHTSNEMDNVIRNTLSDYVKLFEENEIHKYNYKP